MYRAHIQIVSYVIFVEKTSRLDQIFLRTCNLDSLIALLRFERVNSYEILPGDTFDNFIEKKGIKTLQSRYGKLKIGLIKISLHCQRSSSTPRFISITKIIKNTFFLEHEILICLINNIQEQKIRTLLIQPAGAFSIKYWDSNAFEIHNDRLEGLKTFNSALLNIFTRADRRAIYSQFIERFLLEYEIMIHKYVFQAKNTVIQIIKMLINALMITKHDIIIDQPDDDHSFIYKEYLNTKQMVVFSEILDKIGEEFTFFRSIHQLNVNRFNGNETESYIGNIGPDFYNFIVEDLIIPLRIMNQNHNMRKTEKGDPSNHRDIIEKVRARISPNSNNDLMAGTFYTPSPIASFMTAILLNSESEMKGLVEKERSILDLCCGTGEFLINILNKIRRFVIDNKISCRTSNVSVSDKLLKIIEKNVLAVDIDREATQICRIRVLLSILSVGEVASAKMIMKYWDVISRRILTGDAFKLEIDKYFRDGVDAIICNPPYIQEKNNRALIKGIVATRELSEFYMPRTNLYLLFIGYALKILKNGGIICFITPNYFLKNTNAVKLREYVYSTTDYFELYDFKSYTLFPKAPGHHTAIFKIRKNTSIAETDSENRKLMYYSCESGFSKVLNQFTLYNLKLIKVSDFLKKHSYTYGDAFSKDASSTIRTGLQQASKEILQKIETNTEPLGHLVSIKQGVIAGPDKVSSRKLKVLDICNSEVSEGDPVFILPNSQLNALNLSRSEKSLLLPFLYPREIERDIYTSNNDAEFEINRSIIYTDRNVILTKAEHPQLFSWLQKFKPIMELRRENRNGAIEWYHLHWPRKRKLFTQPRLISIRMTTQPRFIFSTRSFVTDLSTNIIQGEIGLLKSLFFILNSPVLQFWFKINAKKKGKTLQIDKNILQNTPIPEIDHPILKILISLFDYYAETGDDRVRSYADLLIVELYMERESSLALELSEILEINQIECIKERDIVILEEIRRKHETDYLAYDSAFHIRES